MKRIRNISLLVGVLMFSVFIALPAWAGVTLTSGGGSYACSSIDSCVAMANSGDTIRISAGTYTTTGQIVIDKTLTIIGEGRPVIMPGADTSGDKTADSSGWWLVTANGHLDLENVVLDGSGHNIFSAIRGVGTGTVNHCDIRNVKYAKYVGFGIWTLSNWTITNNTFENMEREGIMAKFAGVTNAVITGNTYIGKGDGDWLDYGVELGAGAVGTIMNNTITDCRGVASSDGSTSAGIQITTYYGAGTAGVVIGNFLVNNTDGIDAGYDANDTSDVVARYNYFIGNTHGVDNTSGTKTVDASANMWGTMDPTVIATMVTGNVDTSNPVAVGAKGDKGDKGDTGAQGDQGIQGIQGIPGANGTSVTGVIEPAGANCLAGGVKYTSASGDNYVCNGQNGSGGSSSWTDGTGIVTTTQKVGIGTTSPDSTFSVTDQATTTNRGLLASQNTTDAASANVILRKSRGTEVAPTAVGNGDYIGAFQFRSYSGTSYLKNAFVGARVDGTVTSTSVPTDIFFCNSATDESDCYGSGKVRLLVGSTGNIGIGTTAPSQKLEVNGGVRLNTSDSQPACDSTTRGTFWVLQGSTDTVQVCVMTGTGLAWKTVSLQ
jgi:hypothetical protein